MYSVLEEWRPVIDETIETLLPRQIDDEYMADLFGEATYSYDPVAIQEGLSDPIWDLLDRGGKRWRAVLFLIFIEGFGEDPAEYLEYAALPEILHNGTIIVDDVEDSATHRRGDPALHHTHGTDIALNAGNAMYFLPLKVITRNTADLSPETRLAAYDMLTTELNRTHLGQGMDICWHNEKDIRVLESEYLEMCACKTGCLARIVARLAAIVTENREHEMAVANYAERMAIAFQIADDVLDVEYAMEEGGSFGKGMGNDIREGKRTLMMIHASSLASDADVSRLEEILLADDNSDEEVIEAIKILESTESITYAREKALDLASEAKANLDGVPLEPDAADKILSFADFVVEREV